MSGGTAASGSAPDQAPLDQAPVIRVERGTPTPEQLAALTVVLSAAGAADTSGGTSARRRTLWTARSRFARPRPAVGPDGWRASALPR